MGVVVGAARNGVPVDGTGGPDETGPAEAGETGGFADPAGGEVTPVSDAVAAGAWWSEADAAGGGEPLGIGAKAAAWRAFSRSVVNPAVICVQAAVFVAAGLGGTVARFGKGSLSPGGGGRCSAILPPTSSCHQASGPVV